MRIEHEQHTRQEIYRGLREGIRREALADSVSQRTLVQNVGRQAGAVGTGPVNGTWNEDGDWYEFWMLGLTGLGEGGLG
mgnify:FL=1